MRFGRIEISLCSLGLAGLHPSTSAAQTGGPSSEMDTPPAAAQPITWTAVPSRNQLAYYEPDRAQRMAQVGDSSIRCKLLPDGGLKACAVVAESPARFGFGEAAIQLTKFFKAAPTVEDRAVIISVHWDYNGGSTIKVEAVPAV